jgi:hypothetical protein
MTVPFLQNLFEFHILVAGIFLFLSLTLATEVGYLLGRLAIAKRLAKGEETPGVSTLTAGMLGLLAFTLGLSISFAENRFETRRNLVMAEANDIGTAWLRSKLVEGEEGPEIAAKIEAYAQVRLAFTTAPSEADVPALIARTNALQTDIWRSVRTVARRSPSPITAALITALNQMFDDSLSQQFAHASRVPIAIMLGLYVGSLLAIGALGYQFGLGGKRQVVLSTLLLLMWTGGMLLIVDLNQPRMGEIRADAAPLVWTIQGFGPN